MGNILKSPYNFLKSRSASVARSTMMHNLTGREGSGSASKREFNQFLNIARRSTFENANMLIVFERRTFISQTRRDQLLERLDHLSRTITSFQRTLTRKEHGV